MRALGLRFELNLHLSVTAATAAETAPFKIELLKCDHKRFVDEWEDNFPEIIERFIKIRVQSCVADSIRGFKNLYRIRTKNLLNVIIKRGIYGVRLAVTKHI